MFRPTELSAQQYTYLYIGSSIAAGLCCITAIALYRIGMQTSSTAHIYGSIAFWGLGFFFLFAAAACCSREGKIIRKKIDDIEERRRVNDDRLTDILEQHRADTERHRADTERYQANLNQYKYS